MRFKFSMLFIFLTFGWHSLSLANSASICLEFYSGGKPQPKLSWLDRTRIEMGLMPPPPGYKPIQKKQKKLRPGPLPFSPTAKISNEQWAQEFTQRYQESLDYNFVSNTPKPDFKFEDRNQLKADGIVITGNEEYSIARVLHNLGLQDHGANIPKNAKVLSIGEGRSHLVPTLAAQGLQINGVDIWYGAKELATADAVSKRIHPIGALENSKYFEENKDLLVAADATALPYQTGSFDLVLSHQLINNFTGDYVGLTTLAIQEMIRVTAKGGQARIAYTDSEGTKAYDIINQLKSVPWLEVKTYRIEEKSRPDLTLLIITKTEAAP